MGFRAAAPNKSPRLGCDRRGASRRRGRHGELRGTCKIALAAVDAGVGIAAVPRFLLGDRASDYAALLADWTRRAPPLSALYAAGAGPAAQAFVALVAATMKAATASPRAG